MQTTWYSNNTPSFSWSASDASSGIAGYSYVLDQSSSTVPDTTIDTTGTTYTPSALADGIWYLHVRAIDNAGNAERHRQLPVKIDVTNPTVTDNAPAGWSNSAVTVTLSPSDAGFRRRQHALPSRQRRHLDDRDREPVPGRCPV